MGAVGSDQNGFDRASWPSRSDRDAGSASGDIDEAPVRRVTLRDENLIVHRLLQRLRGRLVVRLLTNIVRVEGVGEWPFVPKGGEIRIDERVESATSVQLTVLAELFALELLLWIDELERNG